MSRNCRRQIITTTKFTITTTTITTKIGEKKQETGKKKAKEKKDTNGMKKMKRKEVSKICQLKKKKELTLGFWGLKPTNLSEKIAMYQLL